MKSLSRLSFIFSVLFVVGSSTYAQSMDLPILNSVSPLDNTLMFETQGEKTFMLPTSFYSKFSCTNNSTNSYCFLRVFNDLAAEAIQNLRSLQEIGINVLPLRADIFNYIVSDVKEGFRGSIANYIVEPKNVIYAKNLAFLGDSPYVNVISKMEIKAGNEFLEGYKTSGIGQYVVNFKLKGVKSFERLYLQNSPNFRNTLSNLNSTPISYPQLKDWVSKNILKFSKSQNMLEEEVLTLVSRSIRTSLFDWKSGQSLVLNLDKLNSYLNQKTNRIVVVSEVSDAETINCESTLNLKEQETSKVTCDGIEL